MPTAAGILAPGKIGAKELSGSPREVRKKGRSVSNPTKKGGLCELVGEEGGRGGVELARLGGKGLSPARRGGGEPPPTTPHYSD